MKKLPDLEAWAIFVKVAESGSFVRAAQDLSVSQATVSKAITRLEDRLRTLLFHRSSRRIVLTEAGQVALERASRILHEGEAVESQVIEHASSRCGPVRVAVPMSFGIKNLAPLLPEYQRLHPEVELSVHFSNQQMDLIADRFDMALRIGELADSTLLARKLCCIRILLVGSPEYFSRFSKPAHPRDLLQHKGMGCSYLPGGANWRFQHASQGVFTQVMQLPLWVNESSALMPALLGGMGLALMPSFMVWEKLQSGELEAVMQEWEVAPVALHMVTPPGRNRPARVQAFIDYVTTSLVKAPWAELHQGSPNSADAPVLPRGSERSALEQQKVR